VLSLAAARVEAQKVTREPIQPPEGVTGSVTFKSYCAQCHGVSGKGDGPAAKALKMPPADLTRIARRNRGVFPGAEVKNTITGNHELSAHGTREMPMWGPVFRSVENPSVTELRVVNLVKYLEQIQEK
jgi:mono/diheme cytochrome c family protein